MSTSTTSTKDLIVSVCIQTYQHKDYIVEAIESVLMQKTDFIFEILIGEDESTDGTRDICIDYAKRYPTKIRLFLNSRKNVISINGQPTGRWNLLNNIKHANGKYIALLPGDDYWTDPLKLQKQVDFLENYTDFSGCFHETQLVMRDGKLGKVYGKNAKLIMTAEDTFASLSPFHSSSFIFRNNLGELPDWYSYVVSADMALFSICASYGPLGKIPKIMSVYRKLISGLTNTKAVTDNYHKERVTLIQKLNEYHNFKYDRKAKDVIKYHVKKIVDSNQSSIKLKRILDKWEGVIIPQNVKTITTMLSNDERKFLYTLTRDYWSGFGAVVDGGCFLGGSTLSLAMGLFENENKPNKEVIHTYDLFVADEHQSNSYLKKFGNYFPGNSTRSIFNKNISGVSKLVKVFEGDLNNYRWTGEPIEILFIDVSKTWELNDHIVKEFFPHLIPNHSVVIQQDFLHPTCPWLAITMELFAEYFEPIEYVPSNSMIYLFKKEISAEILNNNVVSKLSKREKLLLMNNAIEKYSKLLTKEEMVELECARAILILNQIGLSKAEQELIRIKAEYAGIPRLDRAVKWVNKRIDKYIKINKKTNLINDPFLNPSLSVENMDIYFIRKSILKSLNANIHSFHGTLLDIGCGEMPYKQYILSNNRVDKYIGLDIESPTYQKNSKPDLFWNGENIPLGDNSVDCSIATELFEHLPDIELVLKEINRVLRPDGFLFFTVPFLWPLHDAPYDQYRYTPFALERHFKTTGFTNVSIKALGGWNASLAQMIGLWLKRSGLSKEQKELYSKDLFIFYKHLLENDVIPQTIKSQVMATGFSGIAFKKSKLTGEKIITTKSMIKPVPDKNKLVIIQGGFPSVSATFILDQMTGLIDRGFELENWATYNTETTTVHKDIEKYALLNKTKYISAPSKKLINEPKEWLRTFMQENNISSFDDVRAFHVHYGSNFNRFEPLFRLNNKFILVSFHGYDASRYFSENGDDCYNFLFKRADLITTPSHFMKDELVKRGCDPGKIIIHRYGIDLEKFSFKNRTFRKDKITFLTVGRFVGKKGIEYSLRAFAKIHKEINSEYRIVGEGEFHDKYLGIVEEEGIGEYVKFLGPKTKTGVIEEMQKADVFVLTSVVAENGDSEGVPVSLTEAHAIGLPIISSYHAGIPELVINERTGLLSAEKDINSIAENMYRIASDSNLRKEFSKNAEARVKEEFDIIKLNDSLYSVLDSGIKRINKNIKFEDLLDEKNWQYKLDLYSDKLEYFHANKISNKPDISVIVISWRLHPDNLKNFEIIEKQRDQNFELIFVDNGGKEGEFDELKPYVDTYVRLNTNTGAYLARNIGAVFSKAPILLFLEDDGIPEHDFIKAHLDAFKRYDVIAVRGVYRPKTDNPLNRFASHYHLGDVPYPYPGNLEGNASYKADCFFKVGGWDDEIIFGHGGRELSLRLLDEEPDQRKQIYSPAPIIYHDFASDERHLAAKNQKQCASLKHLKEKYPQWDTVTSSWMKFNKRYDLLILRDHTYDIGKIDQLLKEGRHAEAIGYLETILSSRPLDASIYNIMGVVHSQSGQKELALNSFKEAVNLEPQNATYQKNLAGVCIDLNKLKDAFDIYWSIVKLCPDTDSLMALAELYNISNRYIDARLLWETVLRVEPENRMAKENIEKIDLTLQKTDSNSELAIRSQKTDIFDDTENKNILPISILIPTYNRANYIEEAILSAINQTYPAYEIIVVDDGSTDDTEEVVKTINSEKIRYIKKDHSGGPETRNRAITEARGEFLLWLDSDDVLMPNALELYCSLINKITDADVYYGDLFVTDEDMAVKQELKYEDWYGRNKELISRLFINSCVPNPGTLIRKSCYERFGMYDSNFPRAHDYAFWCQICDKVMFKHVGETVCKWRWHKTNMSSGSVDIDFSYEVKIARSIFDRYSIKELFPHYDWSDEKLSMTKAYLMTGNVFFAYKDYKAAIEFFEKSLEIIPTDDGFINIGVAFFQTMQFSDAQNAFQQALRINPNNERIQIILNNLNVFKNIIFPEQDSAEPDRKLNPRRDLFSNILRWDEIQYNQHGEELFTKGDGIGAASAFRLAITLNPEYAQSYNNLGVIHWKEGDIEGALDNFRRAIALDPSDLNTTLNLSDLLISIQNFSEAIEILERYLRDHPECSEAQDTLQKIKTLGNPKDFISPNIGNPLVSVIVPTYNRPEMLKNTIKSIMAQNYQNFEIIAVNDYGEDVEPIIKTFGQGTNKIVYIKHPFNKGLAASRNTGIVASRGKYIALLDDDDIFYPNHLETVIRELNEGQRVVYTDAVRATYRKKEDGYELVDKKIPYSIDYDRNKLLLGNIAPVNCYVFERSLAIEAGLFDENLSTLEDWDFWIRLSNLAPFKHIAKPTVQVNWRTDGTTMTSSRRSEFEKNRETIYAKNRSEINKIPNTKEIISEFQAIWNRDTAESARDQKINMGKKQSLVSIIILTFNQLKYTKKCLKSIEKHTHEPHEIIIVDNGSTDGTSEYIKNFTKTNDHVSIILNDENKGFAKGNNQGIAQSRGDHILLLNNDVVVAEHWLEKLISHLEMHPDIGMVGPMSNAVSGPQLVENVPYGKDMKALQRFAENFAKDNTGKTTEVMRLVGFCLLMKKEVLDIIGNLDENYGSGNFEDDDLCLRSLIAGYRNIIAPDVFVHHFGSMTFKGNAIDYGATIQENSRHFAEKWKDIVELTSGGYRVNLTKEMQLKKLIEWGEESFSEGDTERALKIFDRVLRIDGRNSQALNNLGVMQWQLGDAVSALYKFQKALSFNPEDHDAFGNLALTTLETGRFDLLNPDLLEIVTKAQPLNPDIAKFVDAMNNYQMTGSQQV